MLILAALLPVATPGRAQTPPGPTDDPAGLRARITLLEEEVKQLRIEIGQRGSARAGRGETVSTANSSPPGMNRTIEDQLEALDQQIRVLARQVELERERAADASRQQPVIDAGGAGLGLHSADGAFRLRLRGLLQADGRFFLSDDTNSAASTFVGRRARPIVQATLFKRVELRLTPDFGEGRSVIQDAQADVTFVPALRLRAGKFKSPFGLERLASASDLLFIERGAPTAVAPNRDLGLMLYGDVLNGTTSYSAGVFNGVADGASADIDDQDGKDVIGRVFVQPFLRSEETWRGLGVGAAASYGVARGTTALPNLAAYRTTGQQIFFRYRLDATSAGTAIADGTRYRFSGQGYFYAGPLGLLLEQAYSSQEVRRGDVADSISVNSWLAAGSWVLTGERASYRGVVPQRSFDPANGAWGAFEVGLRYHQLVVNRSAFPIFADPASAARAARAWTAGLNWYLNPALKLVFDYEQTAFDGGAALGADRPTAHDLFTRLQVAF